MAYMADTFTYQNPKIILIDIFDDQEPSFDEEENSEVAPTPLLTVTTEDGQESIAVCFDNSIWRVAVDYSDWRLEEVAQALLNLTVRASIPHDLRTVAIKALRRMYPAISDSISAVATPAIHLSAVGPDQ